MTSKEAEDALKDILSTVIYHFADENDTMRKKAWSAVMNLEEAVKAEGVAEGAEQERQRVRDEEEARDREDDRIAGRFLEQQVPSVLAPTKEVAG